jgi:signal transduction histidine kinase
VWYDVGLIASVAIGAWLALDVAMAEGWRRRSIAVGILGACGVLWAASELLLRVAEEAWELALCRRLLYLAVGTGTFCWYWVAVEADGPRWFRDARGRLAWAAAPLVLLHSFLYLGPDGLLISLRSPQPVHGPLWPVHALASWSFIGLGLVHYARAGVRLQRKSRWRLAALAVGVAVPLALNMAYAAGLLAVDLAPCLLAPATLLIRLAVVDTGLAFPLPLARSDVIEQLAVGVVVAGRDGQVIDANASAQRLLGCADVRGRRLADLTAGLAPCVEVIRFPLEGHAKETATAAVLTDRSEAIRAERRLQLAGRLEAIGSLTAGIAHEINNPLAYIYANLNTLEKLLQELHRPVQRTRLPEDLQALLHEAGESLADARGGFDRISALVSRLKGFARSPLEAASEGVVDLEVAAERAAAMARIGFGENVIAIQSRGSPQVRSDDHVVGQILVNLMLNAVQASGDEPHVDVDVRDGESECEIRVSDRGCGLDDAALDRIFDPFYTTKRSGTGLGLSISFDLARRLGGRIEAAKREGGGATFSLFLPKALPESSL